MHIAIEGMDGVGKTTTAKKLAEKINFIFVEKPLHYLFDKKGELENYIKIRDYINQQDENHYLRTWFYSFGNVYLKHKFENKNIITDRHLLSNYFWNGYKETDNLFKVLIENIGKPDLTVLLHISEKEGIKRITGRDENDTDINKVSLYSKAHKKMKLFVEKYDMNFIEINSTKLSADEVVNIILKELSKNLYKV